MLAKTFVFAWRSPCKLPNNFQQSFTTFDPRWENIDSDQVKLKLILRIKKTVVVLLLFTVQFKFPTRGTREDFLYDGTFHEAVGAILAVAQLFGIMPVSGVREKSPRKLRFKKVSLRFVLCIAYIICLSWMVTLDMLWIYSTKVVFGKIIGIIFDFTNLLSLLCFLELATKWPELMIKWNEVEKFLPQLKYQMDKQKMAYEIKMASFVILFISMGKLFTENREHLKTFLPFSGTSSFDYSWGTWR